MKIIGLTGLIGAGKTTVAQVLEDEGYEHLAFADGLKEVVALTYGLPLELLMGDTPASREWRETKIINIGKTPRQILQETGNYMRAVDPDVWVRMLARKMNLMIVEESLEKFVISDIRFPNEFQFVKSRNGYVGEIMSSGKPYWCKYLKESNIRSDAPVEDGPAVYYDEEVNTSINESEWRMQCNDIQSRLDFTVMNVITDGKGVLSTQIRMLIKGFENRVGNAT